jgi:hypothetical protein
MPGSAVQGARAMQCQHPPEERQPVYEGTAVARTDRTFCGLCGHVIYISDSRFPIPDSDDGASGTHIVKSPSPGFTASRGT